MVKTLLRVLRILFITLFISVIVQGHFTNDVEVKREVTKIAKKNFATQLRNNKHLLQNILDSSVLNEVFKIDTRIDLSLEDRLLPHMTNYVDWKDDENEKFEKLSKKLLELYPHFHHFIDDMIEYWRSHKTADSYNYIYMTMDQLQKENNLIEDIRTFYTDSTSNMNKVNTAIDDNIIKTSTNDYRMTSAFAEQKLREAKADTRFGFYKLEMLFRVSEFFDTNYVYSNWVLSETKKFDAFRYAYLNENPHFIVFIDTAIKFLWKSGKTANYFNRLLDLDKYELEQKLMVDLEMFYDSSISNRESVHRAIDMKIAAMLQSNFNYNQKQAEEKLEELKSENFFIYRADMVFNLKKLIRDLKEINRNGSLKVPESSWNCTRDIKKYVNNQLRFMNFDETKKEEIRNDYCVSKEVCTMTGKPTQQDLKKYFQFTNTFNMNNNEMNGMFLGLMKNKLEKRFGFSQVSSHCATQFMKRSSDFENSYTGLDVLAADDTVISKIAGEVAERYKHEYPSVVEMKIDTRF